MSAFGATGAWLRGQAQLAVGNRLNAAVELNRAARLEWHLAEETPAEDEYRGLEHRLNAIRAAIQAANLLEAQPWWKRTSALVSRAESLPEAERKWLRRSLAALEQDLRVLQARWEPHFRRLVRDGPDTARPEELLRRVADEFPGLAQVWFRRSETALRSRKAEAAREFIETAHRLDPEDDSYLALFIATEWLLAEKRPDPAALRAAAARCRALYEERHDSPRAAHLFASVLLAWAARLTGRARREALQEARDLSLFAATRLPTALVRFARWQASVSMALLAGDDDGLAALAAELFGTRVPAGSVTADDLGRLALAHATGSLSLTTPGPA